MKSLLNGKLFVSVLGATAVTVSLVVGGFEVASSVILILGIGELLVDLPLKNSVSDLAGAMSLNVDKVWLKNGEETLVSVSDVKEGDRIIVRTGNMIPLDGKVVEGEAAVNQASMTGEALPCAKSAAATLMRERSLKRANAL